MPINLATIPGAFHLPRPNWSVIGQWVDKEIAPEQRWEAWAEVVTQWMGALNAALGGGYQIERSGNLLFFAPKDNPHLDDLVRFANAGLTILREALGDLVGEKWLGPLPVFLFADAETYGLFVAPENPEDQVLLSAGVCIRSGYVQVALRPYGLETLQRTLLHELTHVCLSHLKLPSWLEEGVTQLAEVANTPGAGPFHLNGEQARELRESWRRNGLAAFWWGSGFHSLDEKQDHSYTLSQVLLRLLLADHRKQLAAFMRHANVADAGESAARQYLGKGLQDLAAVFLGPGDWTPVPPTAAWFYHRGLYRLDRDQLDDAISDFTEAIHLDSKLGAAYFSRAAALYSLERYEASRSDYEEAIRLNPFDADAHNNLAWSLATCSDDQHRDGELALKHALRAQELFGTEAPWYCMGTLAAAFAEVEDFDEARLWAKEALKLAPEPEKADCKERLRLYREQLPYRESGGAGRAYYLKQKARQEGMA